MLHRVEIEFLDPLEVGGIHSKEWKIIGNCHRRNEGIVGTRSALATSSAKTGGYTPEHFGGSVVERNREKVRLRLLEVGLTSSALCFVERNQGAN